MRAQTVSRLRLAAAQSVGPLRAELISLSRQNLKAEIEMEERHRIGSAISARINEADKQAAEQEKFAQAEADAHSPAARRAAGALVDPERADAVSRVSAGMTPTELLVMAKKVVSDGDTPAQSGLFRTLVARGVGDRELKPAFDVLSARTRAEAEYVLALGLVREERALLHADERQALSPWPTGLPADMLARLYEARTLRFGPEDVVQLTENQILAARELLNVPFLPASLPTVPSEPRPAGLR